ncbi:MAG: hypothetical protein WCO04_04695 [Pseudomonadota bacterium]
MKLKLPKTERKWQGRFVRRAEKRVCPTKLTQHRGPIHPQLSVPASADEARRTKHLSRRQDQANSPPNGRPLGGCRMQRLQEDLMKFSKYAVFVMALIIGFSTSVVAASPEPFAINDLEQPPYPDKPTQADVSFFIDDISDIDLSLDVAARHPPAP